MEFSLVLGNALKSISSNSKKIVFSLFIPTIFLLIIRYFQQPENSIPMKFLLTVLDLMANSIFAITIHRIILLGPDSVGKLGITSWSMRETRFALYAIALGFTATVIYIFGIIPVVGGIVGLIIFMWLLMRLSLVFPGIATDKKVSFSYSWDLTRPYQWLMFFVIVATPAFFALNLWLIHKVFDSMIFNTLYGLLVLILEIAMLSSTFKLITGVYDDTVSALSS